MVLCFCFSAVGQRSLWPVREEDEPWLKLDRVRDLPTMVSREMCGVVEPTSTVLGRERFHV